MNPNETEVNEKQHHFLFHIFRMDKAENSLSDKQAETMLQRLKKLLQNKKGEN